MAIHPVDEERINELCPELRSILEDELNYGNSIVDSWKGWPNTRSLYIMFAKPFTVKLDSLPQGISLVAADDPHY
jgi:hypothetical protein